MTITKDDILEAVGAMSVMELNDLVKAFEEESGVSVATVAVAGSAVTGGAAATKEQTEFTVTLKSAGASKVGVIRAVREITGLGLKEARDLVGGAPKPAREGVDKKTIDKLVKKPMEADAEAEAKQMRVSCAVSGT